MIFRRFRTRTEIEERIKELEIQMTTILSVPEVDDDEGFIAIKEELENLKDKLKTINRQEREGGLRNKFFSFLGRK